MSAVDEAGREELLREIRLLDTPDLLALCLRFRRSPERLGLYLAVFRSRPGARAQFAACLACFDLARVGQTWAQREFAALAPTMLELAKDQRFVDELLGGDPYLDSLWSECRRIVATADPRDTWNDSADSVEIVGEIDLLSDLDLSPVGQGDEAENFLGEPLSHNARDEFIVILARQLGHAPAYGYFRYGYGFATETSADLERLENFFKDAKAHAPLVPTARGLVCLGNLFLAGSLRRHTLWGRPNSRRVQALRDGLTMLSTDLTALEYAASILEFEGEVVRGRLNKAYEIVLDFLSLCREANLDPGAAASVELYIALDRQPAPMMLGPGERRRR